MLCWSMWDAASDRDYQEQAGIAIWDEPVSPARVTPPVMKHFTEAELIEIEHQRLDVLNWAYRNIEDIEAAMKRGHYRSNSGLGLYDRAVKFCVGVAVLIEHYRASTQSPVIQSPCQPTGTQEMAHRETQEAGKSKKAR